MKNATSSTFNDWEEVLKLRHFLATLPENRFQESIAQQGSDGQNVYMLDVSQIDELWGYHSLWLTFYKGRPAEQLWLLGSGRPVRPTQDQLRHVLNYYGC